jgi:predicted RNase H-like nuclease
MPVIVGADGSGANWVTVTLDTVTGKVAPDLIPTAALPTLGCDVLAIDIPIGLPESGSREADRRARSFIGIRRSSVFPPPISAALPCRTRAEACAITQGVDGRRVGVQAFALFSKIREVVNLLEAHAQFAPRVYEVHPEVSFTAWAGHQPMRHHKKTASGKDERQQLIAREFGSDAFVSLRQGSSARLPEDDLADAFAALWSARRILDGVAVRLPDQLLLDAAGFPMNIWY